jgi:hypothetical protein
MLRPALHALTLSVAAAAAVQDVPAPAGGPVAWWSLDAVEDGATRDRARGTTDRLEGGSRVAEGVIGGAVVFDGYTTVLRRAAAQAPQLADALTIEGWVALGAYPWNVVPIVDHGDDEMRGFVFGIGPRGELTLRVAADGRWLEASSADFTVPLRKWSHLAARYDAALGLSLFADGRLVAQRAASAAAALGGRHLRRGRIVPPRGLDLLIGAVRAPLRPTPWHRKGTLPSWYSLDGAIDEVKIHDVARSDADVAQAAAAVTPGPPPLPPRVFPSGPKGPGRFGAYFARLSYYPEWDALWRVGPDPDVLVRFDRSPVRVVFWRGTQYSPAWVTDNGLWMADQSVEGYDRDYTYEHMNDKQNRYSHVRLVESSDARVVVHWRYALVNVKNEIWNTDERLGNGAWVDEYYYFYPDATGVRKVTWKRDTLGSPIQYQESLPLAQPGQLQGDVIHSDYVTVGNLAGETQVFSYVEDPKPEGSKPVPADLVVQMHNLKSSYKPFIVFEPGNRMKYLRDMPLANLSRPGSGNHWPVGQILSDGRTALAADRATHSLGFPISEPPQNRGSDGRDYRASLYGMTDRPFSELVELARSWSRAPELRVERGGARSLGYDRSERAYRLKAAAPVSRPLELTLAASRESPIRNLAFVVEGWGDAQARLALEGRAVARGRAFRFGHRHRLDGSDLLVWVEAKSVTSLRLRLEPAR